MNFHKMQGAANDFVVVDGRAERAVDWAALAIKACDRRRGVGADGLLALEDSDDADFRMRYHNADGSIGEMCGNGIRCMAKFALDIGATKAGSLVWETGAGRIATEVLEYSGGVAMVRADMGPPRFAPSEIPVDASGPEVLETPFAVNGSQLRLTCVSMGNPHAVTFVDSVTEFPLERLGPEVEHHPAFPNRTNFEIVEVIDAGHLRMRVWERGVGETMACGTGACAVAVASQMVRQTASDVDIEVPGGRLRVSWRPGENVLLTGPAETSFTGELPW
ncbi:MAG TPA: diaminopimelate epimerase [Candidatus Solibacter sp.]|jgi:diaminopimelate epimerase|nr:diaminopimelate epimerase [Candidatus Solibacter sp.]